MNSSILENTICFISYSNEPCEPSRYTTMIASSPQELTSLSFWSNEEILESLIEPEFPWDNMHHRAYFIPKEPIILCPSLDQFSIESK